MNVADLKKKILRLLTDEVAIEDYLVVGAQTSSELLYDAIGAALDAIAVRIWKPAVHLIEEAGNDFDLPLDLIDIEGVYDNNSGTMLPRIGLRSGDVLGAPLGNAWLNYPSGVLSFLNDLESTGVKVYYSASWTKPEADDDDLETPAYCSTALALYAASYVLLARAAGTGDIRQFTTKVDAGRPTDNPILDMSTALLKRFEYVLSTLPNMQKGSY